MGHGRIWEGVQPALTSGQPHAIQANQTQGEGNGWSTKEWDGSSRGFNGDSNGSCISMSAGGLCRERKIAPGSGVIGDIPGSKKVNLPVRKSQAVRAETQSKIRGECNDTQDAGKRSCLINMAL